MNNTHLHHVIQRNVDVANAAERTIQLLLKGRKVQVISDFNDQQFGRSKRALKGKIFAIVDSFIEEDHVVVWLEKCYCGAVLSRDVELIDE